MTEQELRNKIAKHVCCACEMGLGDGECAESSDYRKCSVCGGVADALISAGIGDVSEWKHRAKRAEKTMIRLAEKYVDAAKINTIKDVNGKIYFAERQACVTYVATMEMLESEKELQEERKDD